MTEQTIKATNKTIKQIVEQEVHRLGNNADLNHIDVSAVTDMSNLFYKTKFNGDISGWDVSNVEKMSFMFQYTEFNGDLSQWDVSNVKDMDGMFLGSEFSGDISRWDVSNVEKMIVMFNLSPLEKKYGTDGEYLGIAKKKALSNEGVKSMKLKKILIYVGGFLVAFVVLAVVMKEMGYHPLYLYNEMMIRSGHENLMLNPNSFPEYFNYSILAHIRWR